MKTVNHLIQTHSRRGNWSLARGIDLPMNFQPLFAKLLPEVKRKHRQESIFQIQKQSCLLLCLSHLLASCASASRQLPALCSLFSRDHQHLFRPRTFAYAFYSLGNVSCSSPSTFTITLLAHTPVWGASQVPLVVKNPPVNAADIADTCLILDREVLLEEGTTTHSSILAWKIPWTEEPGGLQSKGSHGVGHDWSDLARTHSCLRSQLTHSFFRKATLTSLTMPEPSPNISLYLVLLQSMAHRCNLCSIWKISLIYWVKSVVGFPSAGTPEFSPEEWGSLFEWMKE